MKASSLVLIALALLGCGPTAEAITTPTPADATPPAGSTEPPGGPTPIPLSTPSGSGLPGGVFTALIDFPAEGAFEVTDVIATPGGFLAIGFEGLAGESYFGRRQGVTWTSADGRSWARTADPAFEFVTPLRAAALGGDIFLFGLLATCPQLFDDTCAEAADAGNVVWRSRDGGPWERLAQLSSMQLGLVDEVAVGQDRLIAYGSAGSEDQTTTLWLSTDGASWTETTDLGGLDPISALAAGPASYAGFGTRYDDAIDDIQLTAAWSGDGVHFSPAQVPSLAGAAIEDVVFDQGQFVGVGYGSSETMDLSAVIVTSTDGQTWTQGSASDASFTGSGLLAVHALASGGFVALGFTPQDDDFTVQHGKAWLSSDGQSWRALTDLSATFTQFGASALGQAGLIVFTAQQEELDDETVQSTVSAWFAPASVLVP